MGGEHSCVSAKVVNKKNFNEDLYLDLNSDVRKEVLEGNLNSGYDHFIRWGEKEKRLQVNAKIYEMRKQKNLLIKKIIKRGYAKDFYRERHKFNFLKQNIKEEFNIVDTSNISANDYDSDIVKLIESHNDGIILDCGAGYRNTYYNNVVNYEIVDYSTTDVLGVGEKLPFKDNVFDVVISVAVLEHVKDPFLCAEEIVRVLKPGGNLYCAVPQLQPFHGYPHHYFNMTKQGLKTLFDGRLEIERQEVRPSTLPIWSLCWIVQSWVNGLSGEVKSGFLEMKMKEFMKEPQQLIGKSFVKSLSEKKNFELASATILVAKKPIDKNNTSFIV